MTLENLDNMNACEICDSTNWKKTYHGPVRDGAYKSIRNKATIYKCSKCEVERLDETDCIPEEYYETGEYRKKLAQSIQAENVIHEHEAINKFVFEALWPLSIRNKNICIKNICIKNSVLKNIRVKKCAPLDGSQQKFPY